MEARAEISLTYVHPSSEAWQRTWHVASATHKYIIRADRCICILSAPALHNRHFTTRFSNVRASRKKYLIVRRCNCSLNAFASDALLRSRCRHQKLWDVQRGTLRNCDAQNRDSCEYCVESAFRAASSMLNVICAYPYLVIVMHKYLRIWLRRNLFIDSTWKWAHRTLESWRQCDARHIRHI